MGVRTRFAPSPTGFMHIGNLRTCLYTYMYAKKHNGTFILRIEDTDQERYVDGAVDAIYNTLKKSGITHDEGPDKDKGYGPYVQSERKPIYIEYAKQLVELDGAYYCFCDSNRLKEISDNNGVKKYDKHCLKMSAEEIAENLKNNVPFVIRQNVPISGVSEYEDMVFGKISIPYNDIEDGVLIKSDGMPTYNFANVIDDHLMEITHVMRGMEYLSSTPKYNLMYDTFGWERPKYMHLPPIMKDEQHKLSKRNGDANFEDFIEKGFLPQAIINYISLLGWSPSGNREKMDINELTESFDVKGISRSGSIFDVVKMRWLNGEYIKELSLEDFLVYAKPYFDKSKIAGLYDYAKLSELLITRIETFADIPEKINFLAEFDKYDLAWFENKKMKTTIEISKDILSVLLPKLEIVSQWTNSSLQEAISELSEEKGIKKGQIFLVLRLAITASQSSPGGATEMAELLGKEESIRRIKFSISLF